MCAGMECLTQRTRNGWLTGVMVFFFSLCSCFAQDAAGVVEKSMDQKIDEWFGKVTAPFVNAVFSTINVGGYKALWVIFWLAAAGVIVTIV